MQPGFLLLAWQDEKEGLREAGQGPGVDTVGAFCLEHPEGAVCCWRGG